MTQSIIISSLPFSTCTSGKNCSGPHVSVEVVSDAPEKCELKWTQGTVALTSVDRLDRFVSRAEVRARHALDGAGYRNSSHPNATYVSQGEFDALVAVVQSPELSVTCTSIPGKED